MFEEFSDGASHCNGAIDSYPLKHKTKQVALAFHRAHLIYGCHLTRGEQPCLLAEALQDKINVGAIDVARG